jgi:hypothetical protein
LKTATATEIGGVKVGFASDNAARQYKLDISSGHAYTYVPWTDTKNTAGSSNSASDLFIIGATS